MVIVKKFTVATEKKQTLFIHIICMDEDNYAIIKKYSITSVSIRWPVDKKLAAAQKQMDCLFLSTLIGEGLRQQISTSNAKNKWVTLRGSRSWTMYQHIASISIPAPITWCNVSQAIATTTNRWRHIFRLYRTNDENFTNLQIIQKPQTNDKKKPANQKYIEVLFTL